MATADLRRRLADLEAQIVQHNGILRKLEQSRTAVERELLATATFPVLTLPTEITAKVFVHCQAPIDYHDEWYIYTMAVRIFTAVCRAWRGVALATPILWSTLCVRLDGISIEVASKPGLVEGMIDRRLARAGILPLSLIFDTKTFPLNRLRDVIHRHSYRIQYLDLDIGDRDIHELGLDSVAFPLLQRATLHYRGEADDSASPHLFGSAPQFHDLQVPSGSSEFDPGRFTLPWSQLTKFEGQLWDWNLFILAQNLVELKCDFEPIEDFPLVAISHPHLTSFTLMEGSSAEIFEYLNLPALKYLDISKMESYQYPLLEPFLVRSSPPLASLSVRADDDCYGNWHRCLPRIANTLENLEIRDIPEEVMVRLLGLWDKERNLDALSNLRSLILRDVEGGVNLHNLVNYLERSDKLRSFQLVWTRNPFLDSGYYGTGPGVLNTNDTVRSHLFRMARTGMEIYLGTEDKNYASIN
ncbi:hypothetical protein B0H19DRAFT_113676 [Mycena capillaripes]|nr:hypothetical protein B0H19DRAFT_113676 [Mycena capillaripes]